jgi:AraC-like DNA-binding protein
MIGNTSLLAHASSPCHFEFDQAEGSFLVVPFAGSGRLNFERKTFDIKAGVNAAVFPNDRRVFDREYGSSVIISVNLDVISELLNFHFSENKKIVNISEPILIDFIKDKSRFHTFSAICNLIDNLFDNKPSLKILGIDDIVNRWVVSCLLPQQGTQACRVEKGRIDMVCDLVRASMDRPLTLTEMERASGLSARALQYAFKARFGQSPMQWQRQERLLGAQARLFSMSPDESITAIAHSMGFSSSSAFTALYKQQFGETPSETIMRDR